MERDRFGGSPDRRGEARGVFSIQRIDGRYHFVTPDGGSFIAVGFNHIDRGKTRLPYNKDHWDDVIRTDQAFYDYVERDIRHLNMTSYGYRGDAADVVFRLPYVNKSRSFPAPMTWALDPVFPDVFSPKYEALCDEVAAREYSSSADDPMLLGNYVCDCVDWPVYGKPSKRRGGSWIDRLVRMGSDAHGKRAYVSLMQRLYGGDISAFNGVYRTAFSSFDSIRTDTEFSYNVPADFESARRDHDAFLALMADRFFAATCGAIRTYDPGHLVFGAIFDGNREIPWVVLDAASKHVDAIAVQCYGYFKDQAEVLERIYEVSGKPIILADSCFAVATDELPVPCGVRVASQEERATEFARYARQALSAPHVLGWFWCGYLDSPDERRPGRRQHTGLKDIYGTFHEPLAATIRETYADLYGSVGPAE